MKFPRVAIVGWWIVQATRLQSAGASSYWGGPNPSSGYNPSSSQQEQQSYDPNLSAYAPVSDRKSLLPEGWAEYFDPSSGLPYYFNEKDGTTTWDRPVAVDEEPVVQVSVDEGVAQDVTTEENAYVGPEPVDAANDARFPGGTPESNSPGMSDPSDQLQKQEPKQTETEFKSSLTKSFTNQQKEVEAQYEQPHQPTGRSPGWGMPDQQRSTPPAFVDRPPQPETESRGDTNENLITHPAAESPEARQGPQSGWPAMETVPQERRPLERPPVEQPPVDPRQNRAPEQMASQGQQPPQTQDIAQSSRHNDDRAPSEMGRSPPPQQHQQQPPSNPNRFVPPSLPQIVPPQGMRQEVDRRSMPPPQQQTQQQQQQQQSHQQRPPPQGQSVQQQRPPYQQTTPPAQLHAPPQEYGQRPPYQQSPYGPYGQYSQQRGPHPQQGHPYNPYSQYGQYQGYARQPPPAQPRNQLIPAETTTAVQGAFTNAWQGIVGFGNRTKTAVGSATSSIAETAKEASQTISTTSTSWWGQAKNALGNFFEPGPDDLTNEYSLSGSPSQTGNAPGRGPPGYPQGYPGQGYPLQGQRGYPPQGQQPGYPPQGFYPSSGQQQGYPPRMPGYPPQGPGPQSPQGQPPQQRQPPPHPGSSGQHPPAHGQQQQPPPGARWDPPHPAGPNGQRPQYPPIQSQWGQQQPQFRPQSNSQYPNVPAPPGQGQPPPGWQGPSSDSNDGDKKDNPNPWAHPGISGDF